VTVDLPVPERALAVGAHPDDAEFGCGATLAKWTAAGCQIHLLVLTDGSKGSWTPGTEKESLVATRQREQRQAAAILGDGDVTFLGWPDGELRNTVREQWEVSRAIRTVRPDVLLGHDPWRRYRLHPDHRYAGFLLTDALVAARDPLFFPDQDLEPHRPSALLLFEADEPNHVESIGPSAETKVQALLAHRSQYQTTLGIDEAAGDTGPEAFRAQILDVLAEHGAVAGLPAGEAFRLMTEL
jgi:LmbE family N-acetylglucosaminyl deacetylase